MATQDYFHALHHVVTVVNSSLEPAEVLAKVTEQTAKTMQCKACTLRLLDETGQVLLASAAYGLSPDYLRKGPVEVAKSGLDGEVLAGKTIHLRDASSDGRFQYPDAARKEGLISVLSTPLMVEGKAIGLLRVYSDTEREFSRDEEEFMEAVASVSALAIQNARMHAALRADYELQTTYTYQVFED